jgi:type IV secretion system protein VirB11
MDITLAAEQNLRWLLRDMQPLLDDPGLTDLHVNGAGEGMCFVSRGNGVERLTLPYTMSDLDNIAINAAALTRQDIAEDVPLVSTRFPDGQRVQIVRPPAVADGQFAFSIRKPQRLTATPDDLARSGVFANAYRTRRLRPRQRDLQRLYESGKWQEFLELAVREKLIIVFSGEVGSGKTYNMRAFTHAIPRGWRVVTIEDVRELIGLPQINVVNLMYSKGDQSVAKVSAEDLVAASLRMGPDCILNQELRDAGAYAWYNTVRSGHWSMTTVHADSAEDTRDRIRDLIKMHPAGCHLDDNDLRSALRRDIDVIVHCVRDEATNLRYIEQVLYEPDPEPLSVAAE